MTRQVRAPTRSASASTATSRRCARGCAIELDGETVAAARLAFGGMAATVKRAARAEAALRRPALDAGQRQRREGRARRRLQAAVRHARQRRLPPAGRAEPAAALLARDARREPARRARATSVFSVMPHDDRRLGRTVLSQEPDDEQAYRRPAAATRRCLRRLPEEQRRAHRPARRGPPNRRCPRRHQPPARVGAPARRRRRRPTSTTSPNSPARCTARSACRRWRTAASPRAHSTRSARCPAWSRCCRPPTSPARTIAARSSTTTRSSPTAKVRYLGQPVFAVIAETRDAARRAAAKAKDVLTIEPAAAGDHAAAGARQGQYVLPPMHLIRETNAGGAQAAIANAPHRLKGTLDVGGQEQFYLEGQITYAIPTRRRRHAGALLDAAPERDAAPGRARAEAAGARRAGRVPAHGRRLRRQGVAVGAVRVRRRGRRGASSSARSSCAWTATTTS